MKPADAQYTVNVPEGIPALNLDIMRLCAQMVARNGTKFLKSEPRGLPACATSPTSFLQLLHDIKATPLCQ